MSASKQSEYSGRFTPQTDYLPTARLETLQARARLLVGARRFFEQRGYWEVETPLLSHDVVVDAYLEPFSVPNASSNQPAENRGEMFLQTSPEFGMKRLLAAGARAVYQITRAFRQGEAGRYHNPEFTIIEWYRVGDTHVEQMQFTEDLVVELFAQAKPLRGSLTVDHAEQSPTDATQPAAPFPRMTYDAAFEAFLGKRVLGLSTEELSNLATQQGITHPPGLADDDRDGWRNLLLAERVEPRLGRQQPTFLYEYPASQAALARISDSNPAVAERFELYFRGIELCNGYHELTDPKELRSRIAKQNSLRSASGARRLPDESRLLAAMQAGLPPCSGVALGFDRLVMLALGAKSLEQVMAFPHDRA